MKKVIFGWFVLLGISSLATAQPGGGDPIQENTFPPELVMQHQQIIGLSEAQRTAIKQEIQQAQARFTDLQWDLQQTMESFVGLLRKERVDEQRAVAALKQVLDLESEIKQTHLTLAIRIKNQLTPAQQAQLQKLRQQAREMAK